MSWFVDVLVERGIPFRRSVEEILLCCPYCVANGETADERFRLSVNVVKNKAYCFNCRYSLGKEAMNRILREFRVDAPGHVWSFDGRPDKEIKRKVKLPDDFTLLTDVETSDEREALAYLRRRRISQHQIAKYRIGVSLCGRYALRVVFPVIFEKRLRGYVARDYTGRSQPKYLNSVGEKYLFGCPAKCETLWLSEGVFKSLRIERALGVASAAMLGHDITDLQIEQIRATGCKHVCIWSDPDAVGIRGTVKSAWKLRNELELDVRVLSPIGVSPADELEFKDIRRHATSVAPFNYAAEARLRLAACANGR